MYTTKQRQNQVKKRQRNHAPNLIPFRRRSLCLLSMRQPKCIRASTEGIAVCMVACVVAVLNSHGSANRRIVLAGGLQEFAGVYRVPALLASVRASFGRQRWVAGIGSLASVWSPTFVVRLLSVRKSERCSFRSSFQVTKAIVLVAWSHTSFTRDKGRLELPVSQLATTGVAPGEGQRDQMFPFKYCTLRRVVAAES